MTDEEIIIRFLGYRARRFVQQVRAEWRRYNTSPLAIAKPGCIHRDLVRFRLERLAHFRYGKTLN